MPRQKFLYLTDILNLPPNGAEANSATSLVNTVAPDSGRMRVPQHVKDAHFNPVRHSYVKNGGRLALFVDSPVHLEGRVPTTRGTK